MPVPEIFEEQSKEYKDSIQTPSPELLPDNNSHVYNESWYGHNA